jgi:hypothetical protein
MLAGLRALLAEVIDYAGLFPPANLPLEQAFANYVRYRQGPEGWMLGRFVCPASRLAELRPLVMALEPGTQPIPLTVLGQHKNFWGVSGDLQQLKAFRQDCGERAAIEVLELRLANEYVDTEWRRDFASNWPRPRTVSQTSGLRLSATFFEIDSGPYWRVRLEPLLRTLNEVNDHLGFKLRCGGQTAAAFPSAEDVALVITACRSWQVPLKFTAGLHHPVRHFDAGVQATMHGFFNVFGAAVLAHARGLDERQLLPILLDEDAGSFRVSEEGFRWRTQHATIAEIEAVRREVVSFGSCSFDEPREDLRGLGLL